MSGSNSADSHSLLIWGAMALFSLVASTGLVSRLESRLTIPPQSTPYQLQTYAAADEAWVGQDPRISRTLQRNSDNISAAYSFISFSNDSVEVKLEVPVDAYDAYRKKFGYRQTELDALFELQKQQLKEAHTWAIANRSSQEQLDRIAVDITNNYTLSAKALITSRGFRFLNENLLAADIPEVVKRNVTLFRPLALSLHKSMRLRNYSETDTMATALPLVQTAIAYAALPAEENGRITAGFSPPLEVYMEGRGDCDAKSALLASILLNWDKVKLIGVGVPGHYLLGILQHPAKGDAFVEYDGLPYVLMEPSGPAWVPPGIISDYTLKWLDSQDQVILEPISLN